MLLYRWKGYERANAYALRVRGFHHCLNWILVYMWKPQVIREALEEQQRAAVPDDMSFATRQAVKANSVIRYSQSVQGNQIFIETFLATHPLQHYLNAVAAAESAVEKLNDALASGVQTTIEACELKAIAANNSFINGSRARRVLKAYGAIFRDRTMDSWEIQLPPPDLFRLRLKCLMASAQASRRLVLYFDDPKFACLEAGLLPVRHWCC